eukprot:765067-Pyramimonas_sp.AAC.1
MQCEPRALPSRSFCHVAGYRKVGHFVIGGAVIAIITYPVGLRHSVDPLKRGIATTSWVAAVRQEGRGK